MKKKKLRLYFQQSSFSLSLYYLILLLSLLQSSLEWLWQGLLELEFKTIFVLCLLVLTYTRTNFGEQFTVKHFVYLSFWFSCVFNWSSSLLSLALMSSTPKHGKKIVKWWLFKIKLVELERTLIVWRYKAKVSQGLNNFLWQCRYIPEVAFL